MKIPIHKILLCIFMSIYIALTIYESFFDNNNHFYQIVEKGKYNRVQYIIENKTMTPEFIKGYYYIIRDGDTGKETKIEISQEKFETYVLGDLIQK